MCDHYPASVSADLGLTAPWSHSCEARVSHGLAGLPCVAVEGQAGVSCTLTNGGTLIPARAACGIDLVRSRNRSVTNWLNSPPQLSTAVLTARYFWLSATDALRAVGGLKRAPRLKPTRCADKGVGGGMSLEFARPGGCYRSLGAVVVAERVSNKH